MSKTVPQAPKCPKTVTSRTRSRPFIDREDASSGAAKSEKTDILRTVNRLFRLSIRNFEKWLLHKRERGRFLGARIRFSGSEGSDKMVISQTVSGPFRWRGEFGSSGSKSPKIVTSRKENRRI